MCGLYFGSQEIDSRHVAGHRSTYQSRSGCRMCCFCHAQLFEITYVANIKSTLVQHSCRNAEVVEAFCRVAASRSNTRRSIHQRSVAALHAPAEMPTALSSVPRYADVASCSRRAYHRERRRHQIPIAPIAPPVPNFPRLRALALFGRQPPQRVEEFVMPASKNLVWGLGSQAENSQHAIFSFNSISLFDLNRHFFAPTHSVQTLSRAGFVKVGRRSDISSCSRRCQAIP